MIFKHNVQIHTFQPVSIANEEHFSFFTKSYTGSRRAYTVTEHTKAGIAVIKFVPMTDTEKNFCLCRLDVNMAGIDLG